MTAELVSGSEQRLIDLASQIGREHELCQSSLRAGLQHAIGAGRLLAEAKGLCEHGDWGTWIAQHCAFSERTAQAYMQVAREWPRLSKAQRVADLSFRQAVHLLDSGGQSPDMERALRAEAEFNALLDEWQPLAVLFQQVLDNPNASLDQVIAVESLAARWQNRFAEQRLWFGRELGRLLGLLQDDILVDATLQIVLRRDYPDVAKLMGLPRWVNDSLCADRQA